MPDRRNTTLAVLSVLLLPALASAQGTGALSPRIANYAIEARLDPAHKMLEGRETLRWRNAMDVPARELWFHLYWNAWKNTDSTWLKEASSRFGQGGEEKEGDWSYCSIESMRVMPIGRFAGVDLTRQVHYASPDDGNPSDQTVLVAPLSQPVEPGETVDVEISWVSKIPRTFARTGFRGNYFFLAQWFPKVGVYQADGGWNCHQFHAGTEFFSDYGVYDVRLTIPQGWRVGATGIEESTAANADGTRMHRFIQEDVHDFAWTTSPDYREASRMFQHEGLRPVNMRLLYQPEHEGQVERHFDATAAALQYYGSWFGEYPYNHITVIDPAWGSGAGGMEYPTLFTAGSRVFNPKGGGSPEGVTVHEAGHQFWYGVVGNNEFEDAWMDEGFNTFSTSRAMNTAFGDSSYVRRYFRGIFPVMVSDIRRSRISGGDQIDGYRPAARTDIEATPSYLYYPATGSAITYSKTGLWLLTLEKTLGWESLQKIMSTYFARWKFRHPKPADFFAVANEVSGRDLNYFFDEVYRKAAVFDFSVESVSSEEVRTEGLVDKNGKIQYVKDARPSTKEYETRVVVRRLEDGILPVDVLLKFENGEEVRDVWDAKQPWKLYTVTKPTRLSFAAIDPNHKIVLDVNYTNNSKLLDSQAEFAAGKWASKWMIWFQDYMQTVSYLF